MTNEARIAPLTASDLDAAEALSTSVGWNQTHDDWRRLLDLHPGGAFGAFVDGRLVASATIVSFPPALSWIGMVIVDPSMRGRRLGSAVMDAVLASDAAQGDTVVGLDATDLGVPLYERRGFVPVGPVDRWTGVLTASRADPTCAVRGVDTRDARDAGALVAFDRPRADVDRSRLLHHLMRDANVRAWQAERDGETVGYALLRPGRTRPHLGPIVADDDGALASLLAVVQPVLDGREVFIDALRHSTAQEAFEGAGLQVSRRLIRMTRGEAIPALAAEPLRAAVGLEWG